MIALVVLLLICFSYRFLFLGWVSNLIPNFTHLVRHIAVRVQALFICTLSVFHICADAITLTGSSVILLILAIFCPIPPASFLSIITALPHAVIRDNI